MLEDVYPLSPLQEGLYYYWLTTPDSAAYFIQLSYRMQGPMDIGLIEKSYEMLLSRHAILRTCFAQEFGNTLLQIVKKEPTVNFVCHEMIGATEETIKEYQEADRSRGFDLHTGSQMRLSVLKVAADRFEFIWSFHHILMDGWCVGILIKEFSGIYQSLLQGTEPVLGRIHPFSAYIKWLGKVDKEASLQYWDHYLSGYDTISSLHKSAGKTLEYQACDLKWSVEGARRKSISNLCVETGITEYTFFQTAWGILLGKYNNAPDVVFGAVVSGRPAELEGVEEMVGLFANTIPVRVQAEDRMTVRQLLKKVHQASIEGVKHHYIQLAEIFPKTGLGRNLFDHILAFENYPVQEMVETTAAGADPDREADIHSFSSFDQIDYDFALVVMPGEQIVIRFIYNGSVFDAARIQRLGQHFLMVADQMLDRPWAEINEIEYVTDEEKRQLLTAFNDTKVADTKIEPNSGGGATSVVGLFEEQATEHPDNIALRFKGNTLTYKELDEKANRLAGYLATNYQLRSDDLVGIMLDRSVNMIVAVLGILKSGAAYVPIDPSYPMLKKEHILRDTKLKILITVTDHLFDLENYEGAIFAIDVQLDTIDPAAGPFRKDIHPDDLAYVLYTSGSTGQPKGCSITHGNLYNYICWANGYYFDGNRPPNFGLYTSLAFDLTVTSIFCTLTLGGRLTIYPPDQEISEILEHSFDKDSGIDSIKLTPAHIHLLEHLVKTSSSVSLAIVGGEQMTQRQIRILKNIRPSIRIYNEYGPTETTVGCIVKEIETGAPILIGRPISNVRAYMLDRGLSLCPIGVPGEIFIGGAGVGRGYLNNGELTAEKFVPDPFRPGERMYKTGDQGRWLPDGNIEFIGRTDDQVKVRGYRIELGEIEDALRRCDGIESAVVIAWPDKEGGKELAAYLVSGEELNVPDIRSHLAKSLAGYMLPAHFVRVPALPLTRNGKVDKSKLPHPASVESRSAAISAMPHNQTEEKMLRIWHDLLGNKTIGINDNFFDVGGNSIKIMILSRSLSEEFGRDISVAILFQYPRIKELSDYILREQMLLEEETADRSELLNDLNMFNH